MMYFGYLSIFKTQIWDLKEELQHAYFKTKEQKEEIQVKPTVYFSRNSLQEICNKKPLLNKLIINIFHEF